MDRYKAKALLSHSFGLQQMNFTWSKQNDLILFSACLVACWFPQRLLVLYGHLGYKLLNSSPSDGIFSQRRIPEYTKFVSEEELFWFIPIPTGLWPDKEPSGSRNICCFFWQSSADRIGFTLFSPFTEQWRFLFFAFPWLVCCLLSEIFCCFLKHSEIAEGAHEEALR